MSAPISDVVDVSVSTASAAVQAPGFGKALVLATHAHFTDRTREYGSVADMVVDGFSTTEPAYLAALAYFSQEPAPTKIKIGRRAADNVPVAITAVNSFVYTIVLNGVTYTYTASGSTTQAAIGAGLVAAIGSAVPGMTPSYSTGILTLTGTAGTPYSVGALSANLVQNALTATETLTAALDAVLLSDTDFYGLVLASDRASADMQAAATWVSANKRLLFAATAEANVIGVAPGSDTTTLPAILKAAAYDRVIVFYHASAATVFVDAAAAGWVLSKNPGSYTFAFKTLIGIPISNLSPNQRANALGKNANVYEERGGVNQVNDGRVSSGKWVDQIHGRDWLASIVTINIFQLLSSALKVPYTDDGISQIDQVTRQAGALAVNRDYLDSYSVTWPKVASISANDKAARVLNGGVMVAQEKGAIQKVIFKITVLV